MSDFERIVEAIRCPNTGCDNGTVHHCELGYSSCNLQDARRAGTNCYKEPCGVCGGTGLNPDVQVEFDINPWWNVVIAWAKSEGRPLTENHL